MLVNRPAKSLNEGRRAFGFMNGVRKICILYLLPELRFKEMAEFPLNLKILNIGYGGTRNQADSRGN